MRDVTDRHRINEFMRHLGRSARGTARVYFTGGTTAVLFGWRETTVDIDLRLVPERDELFRALPELKERLKINVELASPPDFIPALPGWEDRSIFIGREGMIDFYHFDPYSQALAKIERGHSQDIADVNKMIEQKLVEKGRLLGFFKQIKTRLYKYPAIDPDSFAEAVREIVEGQ